MDTSQTYADSSTQTDESSSISEADFESVLSASDNRSNYTDASTRTDQDCEPALVREYVNNSTQTEYNNNLAPTTLKNLLWNRSASLLRSSMDLGAEVTRQTTIMSAAPFVAMGVGSVVLYALVSKM